MKPNRCLCFHYASGTFTTIDVPEAHAMDADGTNESTNVLWTSLGASAIRVGAVDELGSSGSSFRRSLRRLIGSVCGVVIAAFATCALAEGFLYANGTFTRIHAPGTMFSGPQDVNNADDIVGNYQTDPPQVEFHSFFYAGGKFSTVAVPNSRVTVANGINDARDMVGWFLDPNGNVVHGFLDVRGKFTTIDAPGANSTVLTDINNGGQMVGGTDENRAFVYFNGTFTTIAVPGVTGFTHARGINDAGDIVGEVDTGTQFRGFVYSHGSYTMFDAPGIGRVNTFPEGINNAGSIVGSFNDNSGQHSFVYADGSFSSLDGGHGTVDPLGINDAGHIVGAASPKVFVPEPNSLVLLAIGLLGLRLVWRGTLPSKKGEETRPCLRYGTSGIRRSFSKGSVVADLPLQGQAQRPG